MSNLFPLTDYRHPVITPTFLFINELLSTAPIKTVNQFLKALFVANLIIHVRSLHLFFPSLSLPSLSISPYHLFPSLLQYLLPSKKFSGDLLYFLVGCVSCSIGEEGAATFAKKFLALKKKDVTKYSTIVANQINFGMVDNQKDVLHQYAETPQFK
jgi:hypothetical protein